MIVQEDALMEISVNAGEARQSMMLIWCMLRII